MSTITRNIPTVTMKVIDQGQKKTVKAPADGTWVEQDGTFFSHRNPNTEFSWRPNLPQAGQSAVAETVEALTRPERSIDPGQLNSLPKGSWVAITHKNQGLDEFQLFQVGNGPLVFMDGQGKVSTTDEEALKVKLSSPDLQHFSATSTAGPYAKYYISGSQAFQVGDQEATQLLEATRQAAPSPYGHIGVENVERYKNFAQKLATGIAAPFAVIAVLRNPTGLR